MHSLGRVVRFFTLKLPSLDDFDQGEDMSCTLHPRTETRLRICQLTIQCVLQSLCHNGAHNLQQYIHETNASVVCRITRITLLEDWNHDGDHH